MVLLEVDMGKYHLKMQFKLVRNQMSRCYLGSKSKTNMKKLFFEDFIANNFYTFNKKDPVEVLLPMIVFLDQLVKACKCNENTKMSRADYMTVLHTASVI